MVGTRGWFECGVPTTRLMVDERREKDPVSYRSSRAAATVFSVGPDPFPERRAGPGRPATRNKGYDPLRPDFMEVAGGFPEWTGGAGVCGCWTLVASGTPCAGACGPFFFFEKSGIWFFRFIAASRNLPC